MFKRKGTMRKATVTVIIGTDRPSQCESRKDVGELDSMPPNLVRFALAEAANEVFNRIMDGMEIPEGDMSSLPAIRTQHGEWALEMVLTNDKGERFPVSRVQRMSALTRRNLADTAADLVYTLLAEAAVKGTVIAR